MSIYPLLLVEQAGLFGSVSILVADEDEIQAPNNGGESTTPIVPNSDQIIQPPVPPNNEEVV